MDGGQRGRAQGGVHPCGHGKGRERWLLYTHTHIHARVQHMHTHLCAQEQLPGCVVLLPAQVGLLGQDVVAHKQLVPGEQ